MLPKETPLPAMLLWSGHRPKVQVLTPPKPQPPSVTLDKPKLNFPNKEVQICRPEHLVDALPVEASHADAEQFISRCI